MNLNLTELNINGVYLIENYYVEDTRGVFIKSFSDEVYKHYNINFNIKETYYSLSSKNVIRGMHFQLPPYDHNKLVSVLSGEIEDVVLDLHKNSNTYGKAISIRLKQFKHSLFIPKGCAHGFKTLADNTLVMYNQSTCYSKEHDSGILWNSFGFDWQIAEPILSDRDKNFISFNKFNSPF